MSLSIREFVVTPGHRFPVDVRLAPPTELFADVDWTVDSIDITGEAFAQLSTLYLEVDVHADLTQRCRRCLSTVAVAVDICEPFEITILPNSDFVDILPTVLQMIQAVREPHVLCSRSCQGLCSTCGINLNENPTHVCQDTDSSRHTLRDFLS
ncbi:hypothetical protein IH601_12000 [Candidatus Bipolaricaulota bacterium]|nr:hypothetical protein [Candidatus Bipolaricaulota bacterium]TFH10840.1 MAG: hypothetical protein E4H08_02745 [Candidatus Atribacteria bacterium]